MSGTAAEGGVPVSGASVAIQRGASATKLGKAGSATTSATGAWSASGKLAGKKPVYFKATATVKERDATAQGCATPLPATDRSRRLHERHARSVDRVEPGREAQAVDESTGQALD